MAARLYGESNLNLSASEAEDDIEGEEEDGNWGDWNAENEDEDSENFSHSEMLCLFCDSLYPSSDTLFQHSAAAHHFDFHAIRRTLGLDFYACFKLINYIRAQVSENRCWSCGMAFGSRKALQLHLHEVGTFSDTTLPWEDDKYLRPVMEDDPLLYSFDDSVELDDDEEMPGDSSSSGKDFNYKEPSFASELKTLLENGPEDDQETACCSKKQLDLSSVRVAASEIVNINKSYFGSYSSFAIHKEMISDKVRTDAYRQAILENPSLLRDAIVMDIGCGTGILSLFASQAGATRVIAVEASSKMASMAAQIAKDNGLLQIKSVGEDKNSCCGKIEVVQSMVEELDKAIDIQPQSVDILVSEWMGYCLLYESMLSSVLFARDKWLKPGGAILPDIATMFVAGFGSGGTCLQFWENVYGFNMSCIGKEVVEDAAQLPLVETIDGCDVVTNTEVLRTFDLATMKSEEMDFTAKVELTPRKDSAQNSNKDSTFKPFSCHGLVLWFETGFTERFCKQMPTTLSTSPYTTKTHWSQTVLTFKEPVMMASGEQVDCETRVVGSDACPALRLQSRISIARGVQHRSIDISMEISAVGPGGRKHSWPVQMFNLQ